jgi:hypothetical protein
MYWTDGKNWCAQFDRLVHVTVVQRIVALPEELHRLWVLRILFHWVLWIAFLTQDSGFLLRFRHHNRAPTLFQQRGSLRFRQPFAVVRHSSHFIF